MLKLRFDRYITSWNKVMLMMTPPFLQYFWFHLINSLAASCSLQSADCSLQSAVCGLRSLKRKQQVQGLNGFGGTPLTKLSLGAPRTGGQLINI